MKEHEERIGSSYLTVDEAAERVGVHPSTIRRWIDTGRLSAYRLGPKRIGIKHSDLDDVPRRVTVKPRPVAAGESRIPGRLTREEQERGLQALENLKRLSAQIAARYGKPDVESWVLIDEAREERTRRLLEISEGREG